MISPGSNLCASIPEPVRTHARLLGDGNEALALQQFACMSEALAGAIRSAGGTRVALLARNGIAWVTADIACQMAGLPLLPIPGFFTATQSTHALRQVGVDVLLCDRHASNDHSSLLSALGEHVVSRNQCGDLVLLRLAPDGSVPGASLPEGAGKITYTSGSTGMPKGVCLGNEQLLRQAATLAEVVGVEAPRHLSLLPLSVLLENVAGVYAALLSGGEVLLPDLLQLGFHGSSMIEPRRLLAALDTLRPHTLILVPRLLQLLVHSCELGWQAPSSLRYVAVGGARVAASLILRARECGIPVYEGYGLSECASVVSLNTPEADCPGSAGRALPHLQVTLRDGELIVSGNPFLGYVGDRSSWYPQSIATGDLGWLDDGGFLHLDGRRDNLLVSSFGRNIAPEWIESEIATGRPIAQCVVFGDAQPFLVALVWAEDAIDDATIARHMEQVNEGLPDYARVRCWLRLDQPLTTRDGLLTANGKPRREEIHRHFSAQIARLYAEHEEVEGA